MTFSKGKIEDNLFWELLSTHTQTNENNRKAGAQQYQYKMKQNTKQ